MLFVTAVATLWDKVIAWAKAEITIVETALSAEEHAVLAIVQPILAGGEATLIADLAAEAKAFLTGLESVGSLEDIESALLNAWESEKPELFAFAKGLGSNVFQAILGLLLSQLPKAAIAAL